MCVSLDRVIDSPVLTTTFLPALKKFNPHSADRRQRKDALLPQITKLASEGHGSREIGEKVGVSKTTVSSNNFLSCCNKKATHAAS